MIKDRKNRIEEIYQGLKQDNQCIFCVQYTDKCELKGNTCNSISLRMYYEKDSLEVQSFLKDIYIKQLEEENELLKKQFNL